jgi:DNA-binding transcriptional MocR family regulator
MTMAPHTERVIAAPRLVALLGATPEPADAAVPRYRLLASRLRALLHEGRVPPRARMPAERDLAGGLGVSRTTVTAAYDLLRAAGYLTSRRGSGSWTALPAGRDDASVNGWFLPSDDIAIDLFAAAVDAPADALATAYAQVGTDLLPDLSSRYGYEPYGLPALRAAIAARYTTAGLPTAPEGILVTCGALHGLSLLLDLLCAPGDRVVVETPSYPNAIEAVRRARLRPVPVPVDGPEPGWHTDTLRAALAQGAPKLAYLIADFQNPTGALMPEAQRDDLLAAARRAGTWLVLDEAMADMALDVPPPAPFGAGVPARQLDQVVHIGSFSKSIWGGLRVGWIRASGRLVTELAALRATLDTASGLINQAIALRMLDDLPAILAARHADLRQRRAALEAGLRAELPDWSWRRPAGGLSLWVDTGLGSTAGLVERAARLGVRVASGGRFGVDPGTFERRLRLPFTLPAERLRVAAHRLATAVAGADASGGGRPQPLDWIA